jgi:hypothetical protein
MRTKRERRRKSDEKTERKIMNKGKKNEKETQERYDEKKK